MWSPIPAAPGKSRGITRPKRTPTLGSGCDPRVRKQRRWFIHAQRRSGPHGTPASAARVGRGFQAPRTGSRNLRRLGIYLPVGRSEQVGMESRSASSLGPTHTSQTRPCDAFLSCTLVLIPALDEAGNVGHVVREWRDLGAGRVRVVDNGSRDATAEEAADAGAEVLQEPQRGYGAACQRGLVDLPPSIRWVMFSSADGSDGLRREDLPAWNRAVDAGAALVVGDRTLWAESRRHLKFVQRAGNRLAAFLLGIGWGHRPRDLGSLRLLSVEALHRLGLRDRTFGWNVEMHARCAELGLRVVELPVLYRLRRSGTSKISGNLAGSWRAGRTILATLGKLWWQRPTHRRRNSASDALAGATTTPTHHP